MELDRITDADESLIQSDEDGQDDCDTSDSSPSQDSPAEKETVDPTTAKLYAAVAADNDSRDLDNTIRNYKESDEFSTDQFLQFLRVAIDTTVNRDDVNMIKVLLAHGADPTAGDPSAVLLAIQEKSENVTDFFIRENISFNAFGLVKLTHIHFPVEQFNPHPMLKDQGFMGTALHAAVQHGDAEVIEMLLQSGIDPNKASSKEDWTPLMVTSLLKLDHLIPLLHQHGADVNARDKLGNTALHHATHLPLYIPYHHDANPVPTVKALLAAGADVNIVNIEGGTPIKQLMLHCDVQSNPLELEEGVMIMLESSPAVINYKLPNGETYLHWACGFGQQKVTTSLINRGAALKSRDSTSGFTPFMMAVQRRQADMVQFLAENHSEDIDIDVEVFGCGKKVFQLALENCLTSRTALEPAFKILETLKDLGCDINGELVSGDRNIIACLGGISCHREVDSSIAKAAWKWFLLQGVDVNLVESDGSTLLWCAIDAVIRHRDVDIVDDVLDYGFNMKLSGLTGPALIGPRMTPLQIAIAHKKVSIAYTLFHSCASLSNNMREILQHQLIMDARKHPEMEKLCSVIDEICSTPFSLKQLARLEIRANLDHYRLEDDITTLEIPELVKEFLYLKEYSEESKRSYPSLVLEAENTESSDNA